MVADPRQAGSSPCCLACEPPPVVVVKDPPPTVARFPKRPNVHRHHDFREPLERRRWRFLDTRRPCSGERFPAGTQVPGPSEARSAASLRKTRGSEAAASKRVRHARGRRVGSARACGPATPGAEAQPPSADPSPAALPRNGLVSARLRLAVAESGHSKGAASRATPSISSRVALTARMPTRVRASVSSTHCSTARMSERLYTNSAAS